MITSAYRGHKIEFVNDKWIYSDTKEDVSDTYISRGCGKCGNFEDKNGHDACLGELPGLMNACCGHGVSKDAYVQFIGGFSIHGEDALIIMDVLKRYK